MDNIKITAFQNGCRNWLQFTKDDDNRMTFVWETFKFSLKMTKMELRMVENRLKMSKYRTYATLSPGFHVLFQPFIVQNTCKNGPIDDLKWL